jgi:hypothetical protein
MKKHLFPVIFCLVCTLSFGQNEALLDRLQAIRNNNMIFCNVDGYQITSETFNREFTEKGLKKVFRKYSIDRETPKIKDEQLPYNNLYVTTDEVRAEGIVQNNAFYFIEIDKNQLRVIQFIAVNKRNKSFEQAMVSLLMEDGIPEENFAATTIDTINFAGRDIQLSSNCYWTGVNTVQCPYLGEMNWSVHKDLKDAQNSVAQQYAITASKKNGKILSEEQVSLIFEGTETAAKKIIYDFKGVSSLLASMSGGKTLTVFYVAAPVRGNYVSCVLSFWNNDSITKTGLVPLLDEVMQLKG